MSDTTSAVQWSCNRNSERALSSVSGFGKCGREGKNQMKSHTLNKSEASPSSRSWRIRRMRGRPRVLRFAHNGSHRGIRAKPNFQLKCRQNPFHASCCSLWTSGNARTNIGRTHLAGTHGRKCRGSTLRGREVPGAFQGLAVVPARSPWN